MYELTRAIIIRVTIHEELDWSFIRQVLDGIIGETVEISEDYKVYRMPYGKLVSVDDETVRIEDEGFNMYVSVRDMKLARRFVYHPALCAALQIRYPLETSNSLSTYTESINPF